MTEEEKSKMSQEDIMAAMEADLGIDEGEINEELDMLEATKSINLLKQQSDMIID